MSVAGMRTSTMLDEILTPSKGQIRALSCIANPMVSMPGSERTAEALAKLDLLVTPNVEMSATAKMSHFVLATKNILETPAATHFIEEGKAIHYGYSWEVPHAQYTPAFLDPPPDSDLIEDAHIFYRIAQRMGLSMELSTGTGFGVSSEDGGASVALDMQKEPTTDELFDIYCLNSTVPLDEVRKHAGPHTYHEVQQTVSPRDPQWKQKLDVASPQMLSQLSSIAEQARVRDDTFPFRLIPRRADYLVGSVLRDVPDIHKITYNPAFMNGEDMRRLGVEPGNRVEIRSRHNAVIAIAQPDENLRTGVVSISHSFGPVPDGPDDPLRGGTNINPLLRMDEDFDTISGSTDGGSAR